MTSACGPSSSAATKLVEPTRSASASASCGRRASNVRSSSGPNSVVASNAARHAPLRWRGRVAAVRRDDPLDRGVDRVLERAAVPHERERAAGAQDAVDLRQRRRAVEPVERLADGHGVRARVRERDRLGRARRARGPPPAPIRARISATGSTATTSAPVAASGRVSLPVPGREVDDRPPRAQAEALGEPGDRRRPGSRAARGRRRRPSARTRGRRRRGRRASEQAELGVGRLGARPRPARARARLGCVGLGAPRLGAPGHRARGGSSSPSPARPPPRPAPAAAAASIASSSGMPREVGPQHLDVRGRVERRRRVKDRVQPHRAAPDRAHLVAAVQPRDPGRVAAQQLRREVPERADDARLDELDLAQEVGLAGLDLGRVRVAVAGRPAFQDVRTQHVRARQPDLARAACRAACPPGRRTAAPGGPRSRRAPRPRT